MHHFYIILQYILEGMDKMASKDKKKSRKIQQAATQRLVRVTISLHPEDYAAFERLGEDARLSKSWLIRKAMREFLDRNPGSSSVGKPSNKGVSYE